MSRNGWAPLAEALSIARDRGATLRFWWRDDDAVADTPALRRLLDLAERFSLEPALAAIPGCIELSLADCLDEYPCATVLIHGLHHTNHAPPNAKKAEFGPHRPLDLLEAEAAQALALAREALGPRVLPVFVPPWNRFAAPLAGRLAGIGYTGLSAFGPRRTHALPVLNTHIDPIDWRGTRGALDVDALASRIAAQIALRPGADRNGSTDKDVDATDPIGILTHHLVHDEALWTLCEALFERLAEDGTMMHLSAGAALSAAAQRRPLP